MKVIKKAKDYTIYQKRSGRYGVQDSERNWINLEAKVEILISEGLIKIASASKTAPEKSEIEEDHLTVPVAEDSPTEVSDEAVAKEAEAVAEEASADESVIQEVGAEAAEEEVSDKVVPQEAVSQETEKKPRARRTEKSDDDSSKKTSTAKNKKKTKNGA